MHGLVLSSVQRSAHALAQWLAFIFQSTYYKMYYTLIAGKPAGLALLLTRSSTMPGMALLLHCAHSPAGQLAVAILLQHVPGEGFGFVCQTGSS